MRTSFAAESCSYRLQPGAKGGTDDSEEWTWWTEWPW
jgi:hypothetical protein